MIKPDTATKQCSINFIYTVKNMLTVVLHGSWKTKNKRPSIDEVFKNIKTGSDIKNITFDVQKLTAWDSSLLTFIIKIRDRCKLADIVVDQKTLPQGVQKLLDLASAVSARQGAEKQITKVSFFAKIGGSAVDFFNSTVEMVDFIGDATIAFGKLITGRSALRISNLALITQECGVQALPIVSLICFLVGLIFAFVSAVQLMIFGAQIYVASLVGLTMIRVMGAVMAGVIMAGRTGAAFAAQLGTMEVNEEIDALKTMGISPMEFLVLPRIIALALMMPLLCLYADLMGILGGMVVGVFMLDLNIIEYYNMTCSSISLNDFLVGLFQSSVFGVLVALSGCLRGMQCGRSASDVGNAATSAVVTGIVCIVIATAVITVVCNVLGI
ncbi:MAG: hypothetical protein B6I31_02285 [Desulfobacteraceae bacterium 4572_19]|nr:MAG: hypothetical protein B6I31_02285 [Desulfobacteraceae bacterium 4572_19]